MGHLKTGSGKDESTRERGEVGEREAFKSKSEKDC